VTLNLAETSVVKSRPSVPYEAILLLLIYVYFLFLNNIHNFQCFNQANINGVLSVSFSSYLLTFVNEYVWQNGQEAHLSRRDRMTRNVTNVDILSSAAQLFEKSQLKGSVRE